MEIYIPLITRPSLMVFSVIMQGGHPQHIVADDIMAFLEIGWQRVHSI